MHDKLTHHLVGGVDTGRGRFGQHIVSEAAKRIGDRQVKSLANLRDDALTVMSPTQDRQPARVARRALKVASRAAGMDWVNPNLDHTVERAQEFVNTMKEMGFSSAPEVKKIEDWLNNG